VTEQKRSSNVRVERQERWSSICRAHRTARGRRAPGALPCQLVGPRASSAMRIRLGRGAAQSRGR
jgi:hypothetical protein